MANIQLGTQEPIKRLTTSEKFELDVATTVRAVFPKALDNVYISTHHGAVEMDGVILHTSGIYIIETKAQRGVIEGRITDKMWRITTTRSIRMTNPVIQNHRHIVHLSRRFNLRETVCKSIVVFPNVLDISKVRYANSHLGVCNIGDLPSILRAIANNKDMVISPYQLEDIYMTLTDARLNKKLNAKHKEHLKRLTGQKPKRA